MSGAFFLANHPVRFLIAPDKFKGSLDAKTVAQQIARGIRDASPDAQIELAPVADGGEGTAEIVCRARGGEWVTCHAHDARGRAIHARYAWISREKIAIVEMSEAAGLRRFEPGEFDPLGGTTFGVGELMIDAAARGAREIIVGLGGSGTNDGGLGMARAVGFRFFGGDTELCDGPAELNKLTRIVAPARSPVSRVLAAADVSNPLLGVKGATRVFAPQKGATPEQVEVLECALSSFAAVTTRELGCDFREQPGAGAAGGLGFGLMSFCRAELHPGFDVVADAIHLHAKIRSADVVVTGEGRLDRQTLLGKAPAGVARMARQLGKRVYAVVGELAEDSAPVQGLFDGTFSLVRPTVTRPEAISRCAGLLRERGNELAATIR